MIRAILSAIGLTTACPSFREFMITALVTMSLGSLWAVAMIGNDPSELPILLTLGAVSCVSALSLRAVIGNESGPF
jgi:hypothetical protein